MFTYNTQISTKANGALDGFLKNCIRIANQQCTESEINKIRDLRNQRSTESEICRIRDLPIGSLVSYPPFWVKRGHLFTRLCCHLCYNAYCTLTNECVLCSEGLLCVPNSYNRKRKREREGFRAWFEGGQIWQHTLSLLGLWWGGGQSSVRQSSSGKAFQSFVIHFGLPLLTSEWTRLALQGNGEGSRVCCIVVQGKQGSNAHDQHSPRSGKGEDPAQRWTRGFVIGHTREAEMWRDLMSTDDLLVLRGCSTQCLFSLCLYQGLQGRILPSLVFAPNNNKALERCTCIFALFGGKRSVLVLFFLQ